jgi:DNA-3-methyladenine glycosylase
MIAGGPPRPSVPPSRLDRAASCGHRGAASPDATAGNAGVATSDALARPAQPDPAGPEAASAGPATLQRLCRRALPRDTVALARFLIGKTLVHDAAGARLSGRIVETEAYLVGDAASHAFRGETKRNRAMFLARGHAYVYIAYGVWPALNVASEEAGTGAAVLLRALEPLEGLDAMRSNRGAVRDLDLARGPGRLAGAMAVTLAHDAIDLCGPGPLYLAEGDRRATGIVTATRIGITKDAERPLRFFERGNRFVSGPRRLIFDA